MYRNIDAIYMLILVLPPLPPAMCDNFSHISYENKGQQELVFVTRAAQFVMLLFTSYDWYWPLSWQHCIFWNIWNCLIIIILVKSAEYLYLQWCTTCHVRNIYCSNSFEEDQTKNIFTPRIFILSCDIIPPYPCSEKYTP